MTGLAGQAGWRLVEVTDHDIDELMSWFGGPEETDIWAGPRFRFPFTRDTFREDCQWERMPGFRLISPDGQFAAFGQMYRRYGRINFARLVVNPAMRGQGVGKRLVGMLMKVGPTRFEGDEFSLFAYRHNAAALGCYRSMGFVVREYPKGARMAELCYYLTRPV